MLIPMQAITIEAAIGRQITEGIPGWILDLAREAYRVAGGYQTATARSLVVLGVPLATAVAAHHLVRREEAKAALELVDWERIPAIKIFAELEPSLDISRAKAVVDQVTRRDAQEIADFVRELGSSQAAELLREIGWPEPRISATFAVGAGQFWDYFA